MFKVPQAKLNEFKKLFQLHQRQISDSVIYFENVKMLNGRHRILDRDTYVEYYKNFTWDIELTSSPIDAFVPYDGPDEEIGEDIPAERKRKKKRLFTVNDLVPEYKRIANRVTSEELHQTLPATHPVIMALDLHEVTMQDVLDDIFIYYSIYKYLERIERLRVEIFVTYTPVIEWTVNNIKKDELTKFLVSNRIREEKLRKYNDYLFLRADFDIVCAYYNNIEKPEFQFDMSNLLKKLISNIVLKTDIYIILAIYLTASFAIADIKEGNTSPCTDYVKDVIVANHFDA